jgi:hypothetical protein
MIPYQPHLTNFILLNSPQLTDCGFPIVEMIGMSKRKATEDISSPILIKSNTSKDEVYYMTAKKGDMVYIVSPTKIGKGSIYKWFIDFDGQYFLLRCMRDLGSTSFIISQPAAKCFGDPVVKRTITTGASDISSSRIITEGLFTIPLRLPFRNDRTPDDKDHAFEVMKTSSEYNTVIPAGY